MEPWFEKIYSSRPNNIIRIVINKENNELRKTVGGENKNDSFLFKAEVLMEYLFYRLNKFNTRNFRLRDDQLLKSGFPWYIRSACPK